MLGTPQWGEERAYSLSETASLSLRCSSLPSANLLLLSVASTHLQWKKNEEIGLRRENWKLLETWVLFTFKRNRNWSQERKLETWSCCSPFAFLDALSKPLYPLQLLIQVLIRVKYESGQGKGHWIHKEVAKFLASQMIFKSYLKPPWQKCCNPLDFLTRWEEQWRGNPNLDYHYHDHDHCHYQNYYHWLIVERNSGEEIPTLIITRSIIFLKERKYNNDLDMLWHIAWVAFRCIGCVNCFYSCTDTILVIMTVWNAMATEKMMIKTWAESPSRETCFW